MTWHVVRVLHRLIVWHAGCLEVLPLPNVRPSRSTAVSVAALCLLFGIIDASVVDHGGGLVSVVSSLIIDEEKVSITFTLPGRGAASSVRANTR